MSKNNGSLLAIIWDYDGTLVDSRKKNFNVTCNILSSVTGRPATDFPAMQDMESYDRAIHRWANWREFYANEFRFSGEQIDSVGPKWTPAQLSDQTTVELIPGIDSVLKHFSRIAHGIVSQNARDNMSAMLQKNNLLDLFPSIIGYEQVDIRQQKPHPLGLLKCIEELAAGKSGTIVYIGDHETDALCARNAAIELKNKRPDVQIKAVAADYLNRNGRAAWSTSPDFFAERAEDLVPGILKLAEKA